MLGSDSVSMPLFGTNPKFGRHICPVGGMDGNGQRVTGLHQGKDTIAQCARPNVTCLGSMEESYDEKGNDTNVEAVAELRATTAISVK